MPGPAVRQELTELGPAARGLTEDALHTPGRAGPGFGRVVEITLVGTTVLGGALAAVHLWRALTRHRPGPHRPAGRSDHENGHPSRRPPGRATGRHVHPDTGNGRDRSGP